MIKIIDDPTRFVIDVLRMELEQKLPYWLSPEGKGLKEDAVAANHTGPGIATFDPLLMRRKRRERFFKRKPPVMEADIEGMPLSGGPGETDMNSVVSKKKFRIRHRKPLRETYNPNEPREPRGIPHGGRWTRFALSVKDEGMKRLYRGDASKIDKFDMEATSLLNLFGRGIYLTDNKRVAADYTSKGTTTGDILLRMDFGRHKATKQKVIDKYIEMLAKNIDSDGKEHNGIEYWSSGYPFLSGQDWTYRDMPKNKEEFEKRMEFARKKWNTISKDYSVRVKLDRTAIIQKKATLKNVTAFTVPKKILDSTLNADKEIDDNVLEELLYALKKSGDESTAKDIESFIKQQEWQDEGRPTFRKIYTSITADSPLTSDEETQASFRDALKELGYTGIRYTGGVTMGGGYKHTAYVLWDLPEVASVDDVWTPEIEDVYIPFPPIKMGEEDQTISKETIDKLHLTEDDLKARRRVLTQGNEDKSEHLIAFDDVGWENLTSNALTHVSLPDTLVETLRNTVARYTMVHNHPWDSSLSGADLNIAALPGVKRMFAHVATGSIYSVEQTQLLRDAIKYSPRKYGTLWNAMSISVRTINDILSPFNLDMDFKVLGIEEKLTMNNMNELRKYWNRIASHLNCLLLNDAGVFKYTYHMDPKLEAFYAPLIKKATESKDWQIAKNAIYQDMRKEVDKHKAENEKT